MTSRALVPVPPASDPHAEAVAGSPSAGAVVPSGVAAGLGAFGAAALALGTMGAGAVLARAATLARDRRDRRRAWGAGVAAGAGVGLGAALVRWQLQRLFTEQVPYVVEGRLGDLEIRRYPAGTRAETRVASAPDFEALLDVGFRRVANYIFGGNARREHIAMTTPVFASRGPEQALAFAMPAGRPRATLPDPTDDRVSVVEVPERLVAVLRFSGAYDESRVAAHERELLAQVREAGLETRGSVEFAGYDPPSTLPPLRRVEVSVEVHGVEVHSA